VKLRQGNHHGTLICVVGIDGSGKTTVGKRFTQVWKESGECIYLWSNLRPWLMRLSKGSLRMLKGGQQQGRAAAKRLKVRRSRKLRAFYSLWLADYVRYVWFRIGLPLLRGCNVVSDRYAYDVMVNMGVNLGWSHEETAANLDRLLGLLPKPAVVFYLDVPAEVSISRRPDAAPALEFLLARQAVYEALAPRYQMVRLDATRRPEQIVDEMVEFLALSGSEQALAGQPA
jgi:thymidylate kinase